MSAATATHVRPRVLYITHRVPWPPDKGDRIRNWNVLSQLTTFARVSLATLDDVKTGSTQERRTIHSCETVEIFPQSRSRRMLGAVSFALARRSLSEGVFYNTRLKDTIEAWHKTEPFDVVVVSASSLVPYLRHTSVKSVPAFIDVVDVDSQKWLDFAVAVNGPKGWLYRFEGNRIRNVERDLPEWAHTITLVSDAETRLFNEIAGHDAAITATNGVDLEYFSAEPEAPARANRNVLAGASGSSIAFVGAMDYLPNIDAVTWFAREVFPSIRVHHPTAEFRVIGREPSHEVQTLTSIPGVKVIGGVPDVRPHVHEAALVVAPMRLGRGLQNKVLEALAMGQAVIASPPALAAIAAVPGHDLLKAESPREWIDAVKMLLDDAPRRRELGVSGRRFVEEHHDWETCLRPMMDRIRSVCPEACPA